LTKIKLLLIGVLDLLR